MHRFKSAVVFLAVLIWGDVVLAASQSLQCGSKVSVIGIRGFTTVILPGGNLIYRVGGETRVSRDGISITAIPYDDGSVLYVEGTKPVTYYFKMISGPVVKCVKR